MWVLGQPSGRESGPKIRPDANSCKYIIAIAIVLTYSIKTKPERGFLNIKS